jgi:hypothetical protein
VSLLYSNLVYCNGMILLNSLRSCCCSFLWGSCKVLLFLSGCDLLFCCCRFLCFMVSSCYDWCHSAKCCYCDVINVTVSWCSCWCFVFYILLFIFIVFRFCIRICCCVVVFVLLMYPPAFKQVLTCAF